ncbi:hypothetical protein PHSY_006337 [Pseudozyma hubeiensis SY62]|uniref:Uncharacterized protein n=1 Tax=Pseudozyma hubeiensis (strain SY62) TaxID=1305764 RepID=R9PBF8_PSEHS|nr:hypothetical protein PHSY_006337 [Pseudozyma hubeiensis SY62]GAC98743.1 hypothetical protein PHSY_006337 [Pseudozyma hubeiensis SY62]
MLSTGTETWLGLPVEYRCRCIASATFAVASFRKRHTLDFVGLVAWSVRINTKHQRIDTRRQAIKSPNYAFLTRVLSSAIPSHIVLHLVIHSGTSLPPTSTSPKARCLSSAPSKGTYFARRIPVAPLPSKRPHLNTYQPHQQTQLANVAPRLAAGLAFPS